MVTAKNNINKLIACIRYLDSSKIKDTEKFIRSQQYFSKHIRVASPLVICGCYKKTRGNDGNN